MEGEASIAGDDRIAPWKDAMLDWVRSDWPDLTNRQLALLMVICHEPGPHRVRQLADRLAVPKCIISRVIDRLSALHLVARETDRRDRRNVFATPTEDAFRFLDEFNRHFGDHR